MTIRIETSEDISELSKALPVAQAAITKVQRDAANPHFNSKYASMFEISDAILPAMNKHGIAVLQPATSSDGAVEVTTRLQHTSGQWIQATHIVPVSRRDAQGIGSALTYARRQALQAFMVVAPQGEDDDGESAVGRGSGKPPIPPAKPTRPGLYDRLGRLERVLKEVTTLPDLVKSWDLAKALREELQAEDAERFVELVKLYDRRGAELGTPGAGQH